MTKEELRTLLKENLSVEISSDRCWIKVRVFFDGEEIDYDSTLIENYD